MYNWGGHRRETVAAVRPWKPTSKRGGTSNVPSLFEQGPLGTDAALIQVPVLRDTDLDNIEGWLESKGLGLNIITDGEEKWTWDDMINNHCDPQPLYQHHQLTGIALRSRPSPLLRRMDHPVAEASDAADCAYYCPLCSRRIKGQTEFSLAQHIWACHAKSKEAGEMSRRFKAGDLGNLRPALVERGAGRGRSLPATVRSVERGASVRSQRSVQSAPELHQKEDRWKEPEQHAEPTTCLWLARSAISTYTYTYISTNIHIYIYIHIYIFIYIYLYI